MFKNKFYSNLSKIYYIAKSQIKKTKNFRIPTLISKILLSLMIVVGWLLLRNNSTPSPTHSYQNDEFKFKFIHSPATKVYNEEKSVGEHNNRQLSVVFEDSTLIVNQIKDDQLYFIVEVWKSSAPYVSKICKSGQQIQLNNLSAVQNTYTDKYDRLHRDTCINKDGMTFILMSSVSTKYNNQAKVDQFTKTILDSFTFY